MRAQAIRFGPFRYVIRSQRLYRGDWEIHLTSKSASVLRELLRRPGDLVTKVELLDAVWHGVNVSDASLTQAISVLRHALGDSVRDPQFIRTEWGAGYRFIANVIVDRHEATASRSPGRAYSTFVSFGGGPDSTSETQARRPPIWGGLFRAAFSVAACDEATAYVDLPAGYRAL